jgi:hypothetical protein
MGKIAGSNPAGTTDGWCLWCSGMACDAVNVEAAGSIPLGYPGERSLDMSLEEKFLQMGARLKVRFKARNGFARHRAASSGLPIVLDVLRDEEGEFFEVGFLSRPPARLDIVDLRPADRHLLLMVENVGEKHKFLCGRDERHWFVAAIPEDVPGVGTVRTAIEALKPTEVHAAQASKRLSGRDLRSRKNAAYIRQGEWFFVPAPDLKVDEKLILRNEPITRGNGGKPHWADYCYRVGGEQVYVCSRYPNGLIGRAYEGLIRDNPAAKRWGWRLMVRDAQVYVRGQIRHSDHKAVGLHVWHRVFMNTETRAAAMRNVAFLD